LPALNPPLPGASPGTGKATDMKIMRTLTPLLLIGAAAVPATASAAPIREFEGNVVSVNRDARTFRLHDSERGTKRIKITANTRFERINGFSGLHAGMRNIEATVRHKNGRWVAIEVERSGGGGDHGGGDDDD
jgi:hypothetical protein